MRRTLTGPAPETQFIASRLLRFGDHVARDDDTFGVVIDVLATEADTVTIEYLDGELWMGEGTAPFPVAICANDAHEWNRRRGEHDQREAS
jgi:hypothetical protein